MTKRNSEFGQKNKKKRKLDDDIEALWGDELDSDVLDDCIQLAAEVHKEETINCTQLNNISLLPTYSTFKERNNVFSSTQIIKPSTSKNEFPNKAILEGDLDKNLKSLQQQYEEKEGEVSILRMQIQDSKANFQVEQQKLQNEWKQKFIQTERQMNSVRSELEFKNLEIANLKHKILEFSKHIILHTNGTENVLETQNRDKVIDNIDVQHEHLQPILDPIYPLMGKISETIFETSKREQHIIENKLTFLCNNTIPYLQNQLISTNVVMDKSDININSVFLDIFKLIYCTEEELDEKENVSYISKIVCACEQNIYDMQNFLHEIKENLKTEDVLKDDSNYLKCNDQLHKKSGDEIGVKSSVILLFLAELLLYNENCRQYICQDKLSIFLENGSLRKQFLDQVIEKQFMFSSVFLNNLLNVIQTAGEIRKISFISRYVISTIKLLINIHKSKKYDFVSDIFCKLSKEIIISRPSDEVVWQLTLLFKVAAQNSSFIEYLLSKSENSMISKNGILYFNNEACCFYIFVMLLEARIFEIEDDEVALNVYLNLLCFMYNAFKNGHWIHLRDSKECDCVPHLYKLEIEIMSRALDKYMEEMEKATPSEWSYFFMNPITSKVLSLMSFNSCELTEKYITAFSQYKYIEKRVEEESLFGFEKLNITGEVIEISNEVFATIDF